MVVYTFQALLHASVACRRKLIINWVSASDLEDATAIDVNINSISFILTMISISFIDRSFFLLQDPDVNKAAWNSLKVYIIFFIKVRNCENGSSNKALFFFIVCGCCSCSGWFW